MSLLEKLGAWFLLFLFYSFAGWLMEVVVSLLERKKLVNRGFLVGPICPIYGTGATLLSLLLHDNKNVLFIFAISVLGGALLEYSVSYLMEKMFRVRWWDYSKKKFNLNGRIYSGSVFMFGIMGIFIIRFVTPAFFALLGHLPASVIILLASLLFALLLCDLALSLWLILGVRVTVGTIARDATEEISERVHEVLMEKGKLNRRLVRAFPNQSPSKKTSHRSRRTTKHGTKASPAITKTANLKTSPETADSKVAAGNCKDFDNNTK